MRTLFQFKHSQFDLVECDLAWFPFILLQFQLMGNWLKFWLSCTEANSCRDLRCSCSPAAHSVPLPDLTVPGNLAEVRLSCSLKHCGWYLSWCKGIFTHFLPWIYRRYNNLQRNGTTQYGQCHIWRWQSSAHLLLNSTGSREGHLSFHWHEKNTLHCHVPKAFKYFA